MWVVRCRRLFRIEPMSVLIPRVEKQSRLEVEMRHIYFGCLNGIFMNISSKQQLLQLTSNIKRPSEQILCQQQPKTPNYLAQMNLSKIGRRSSSSAVSLLNDSSSMTSKNQTKPYGEQALLNKVKKCLVQIYKPVKKHVKQSLTVFDQQELHQIYQGISSSLKTIDKCLSIKAEQKQSLTGSGYNQLSLSVKGNNPSNSVANYSDVDSVVSGSIKLSQNDQLETRGKNISSGPSKPTISQDQKLVKRIKQLQKQLEESKQLHSQQVRNMIQSHQEQIAFVQREHQQANDKLKQDFQRQFQMKLEIQVQQMQMEFQERIANQGHKMQKILVAQNQQVKQATQFAYQRQMLLKALQKQQQKSQQYELKIKDIAKLGKQKVQKLKIVLSQYNKKLKKLKQNQQNIIEKQVSVKLNQLQSFLDKYEVKVAQSIKKKSPKPFLLQLEAMVSKMAVKDRVQLSNKEYSMPGAIMAGLQSQLSLAQNEQQKSAKYETHETHQTHETQNGQWDSLAPYQRLQDCLQQLIRMGFFCEQNQSNINSLFDLAANCDYEAKGSDINFVEVMESNLYPILVQKIKLVIESQRDRCYPMQGSGSGYGSGHMRQFNYEEVCDDMSSDKMGQFGQLLQSGARKYGRHIQSMDELNVSDSLMDASGGELDCD